MSAYVYFNTVSRLSKLIRQIENKGITVTVGTDFRTYRDIRYAQSDKRDMCPVFDALYNFIDDSNGFWIIGHNEAGEVVHTQGVRKLDLGSMTLKQHFVVHAEKYLTVGLMPSSDRAYLEMPYAIRELNGTFCYHGEFWLKGGPQGFRGKDLTQPLTLLGLELAYAEWNPQLIFCLVPTTVAVKGATVRYGYSHAEPCLWKSPEGEILMEELVTWMTREDILRAIDRNAEKQVASDLEAKSQAAIAQLSTYSQDARQRLAG